MQIHEIHIKRCLKIANNGLGSTRPNPMVGAIIVCDDKVIGEGFTSPYGQSHAEVNAINAVKNKALLKKSTLYVTLEPCAHHGKTPPCADALIAAGIARLVVALQDPDPRVDGNGLAQIAKEGIIVCLGVEAALSSDALRYFFNK